MIVLGMLIVFLLVAFPVTEIGKRLRELLVDLPARWLSEITPGRVVLYAGLGLSGLLLICLFEAEGGRLFAFMAPDLIIWFTVFDIALYVDVFLLGATLVATIRVKAVRMLMARILHRVWGAAVAPFSGRGRGAKPRRTRKAKTLPEDPDPWAII